MSENKNNNFENQQKDHSMSIEECELALNDLEAELNALTEASDCDKNDEPSLDTNAVFGDVEEGFKSLDAEKESEGAVFAFTLTDAPEENARVEASCVADKGSAVTCTDDNELFITAARMVVSEGVVSASFLQRSLSIGYGRASAIIERLEELSIISPIDGNRGRRVIVSSERLERILAGL